MACDQTGQCTECADNTYLKVNPGGENQCIDCTVFGEKCETCDSGSCTKCESIPGNPCALVVAVDLDQCLCLFNF